MLNLKDVRFLNSFSRPRDADRSSTLKVTRGPEILRKMDKIIARFHGRESRLYVSCVNIFSCCETINKPAGKGSPGLLSSAKMDNRNHRRSETRLAMTYHVCSAPRDSSSFHLAEDTSSGDG